MISVFRKGRSHNKYEFDSSDVHVRVSHDQVELSFQTAGGRGVTDIALLISSDSRKLVIDKLLAAMTNGKPKNITDYTRDELLEALQAKLKSE